ncbi:MAG TPA: hypothetical protein VMK12_17540 [Anaeromyxobacteraceae bacterium]|nr:hypothetical protein [Anaeromyxobacteraceae bacterium]
MSTLVVLALLACGGPKGPYNVRLGWKPTDDLSPATNALGGLLGKRSVRLTTFADGRQERGLIGRNIENPDRPIEVLTSDDVGLWATARMSDLLRKSGIEIVDSPRALVLGGKVTEFFVNEGQVYKGKVTLLVTLTGSGRLLWKGVAAGQSSRWGRSLSEDNYREVVSDAYVKAVEALVSDEGFQAAVRAD